MSSAVSASGQPGRFELGHAVSVSRGLIKGTKRHVFALGLLFWGISFVVGWFWGGDPSVGKPASLWYYVAFAAMSGVAVLPYTSVGLLAAAGEKVTFGSAFRYMNRLPSVLLVTVPLSLVFTYLQATFGLGGSMLLSLAVVPMAFWTYFLVDRDMNPLEAIASSYTLVLNNLGGYLVFLLLVLPLAILGVITLGIAVIWIMPFVMIVPGVMFAMAEGLQRDYSA